MKTETTINEEVLVSGLSLAVKLAEKTENEEALHYAHIALSNYARGWLDNAAHHLHTAQTLLLTDVAA